MAVYSITISDELDESIKQLSEHIGMHPENIIQDYVVNKLESDKASIIIKAYKDGHLKAREAWKLSGLSYQEFQNLANT